MTNSKAKRTRRITLPFASVDEKPYIFASYGHDDKEIVFPLLKQLYEEGYNVWYDEGITIGEKYDEVIENHIRQSAVFILFASSLSLSRPYITDVELKTANDNLNNVPILTLYIEDDLLVPDEVESLLPQQRFNNISQVIEHLKSINLRNFGKRTAVPIERDVPQYWFDGHDIDPAGGTKNAVYSKEAPYACIAFHPDDLVFCNPYIKELYFAGYNVRSCENYNVQERAEMIDSSECEAYVPFVTKRYVESGQLERDYGAAKRAGKTLIALYIPTYDKEGKEENFVLPASISKEFSLIQGLSLKELTNNDFISKLEIELEKSKCYASEKDGKVERRSFEIKDFLYDFTEDRKGIVLTQYRGDVASVVIKTAYSGFPVREIGDSAFSGSNLTDITIPDSVTSIGKLAFFRCSSLTGITIPDGVTSIGDSAFFGCSSLTSITIPDSVTSIGACAFDRCVSLTGISVNDNNINYCDIDGVLFSKDKTLLIAYPHGRCGDYSVPDSVTSIDDSAFFGCRSLTGITIPDSVTDIGFGAFVGCSSLTDITIPDSVTSIGELAFESCRSLAGIIIPDSVTSIGKRAFWDCRNLTGITIPNSVTSIGERAFSGCISLTGITIPDSVTSISDGAFSGCSRLTGITIPDSVTSIGAWAFSGCSRLTGITIPDSVTSIGLGAFSGWKSLTDITIPDSVTSIGELAFSNCSSLSDITIPDSVTSIGSGAFFDCSSLTGITIPDSVTSIGDGAFSGCRSLTVRCSKDSFAWQYCEENGIKHRLLVCKKSPAGWLIPLLILLALALAAAAGLQLSGLVDILGLLGL